MSSPSHAGPRQRPPLDMAELATLTSLPLRARTLADAIGAGRHRSGRQGASVEFADYRDYHPGDDLRRVDWRLLARTDRAHLREAYAETPMRVILLLDISASMDFRSRPGLLAKSDFARSVLGAIALIVRRQRDACGIGFLDEELGGYLQPGTSPGRYQAVWAALENPPIGRQTRLASALNQAIDAGPRSCLFVLASDFYEQPDALVPVVRRCRFEGHDVLALHVADPEEVDFTRTGSTQFQDAETGRELPLDAGAVASSYRAGYAAHHARLHELFVECGFGYLTLRTDAPPLQALGAYLARRAGRD